MSGENSTDERNLYYWQTCHRCKSDLKFLNGHYYCLGCNWDSLTDPINSTNDSREKQVTKKQPRNKKNEN